MVPHLIWDAITGIYHFFRDLCTIEILVDHMKVLEGKICETICKLKKSFALGFFDFMEHLSIHLPYEAKVDGPDQYRWMYPFERFLQHLKKVKNRALVEGSICEAYIIEEISSFCS
ncbi:Transposase tnp2 [Theobroma cacao]|uniref:Transposase tnp2 n=1 Tax=Theobroma cacao TaxID=3641 RepID=A0A061FW79_THECC|nr:Transposase tnp2 [Theobroma cacao]